MARKGYSAFPKAPALLEPYHQIVYCHIQDTRWWGVLPLCRGAVSIFYSPHPSRLGNFKFRDTQQTTIFVLPRKTWRIKTQNDFRFIDKSPILCKFRANQNFINMWRKKYFFCKWAFFCTYCYRLAYGYKRQLMWGLGLISFILNKPILVDFEKIIIIMSCH